MFFVSIFVIFAEKIPERGFWFLDSFRFSVEYIEKYRLKKKLWSYLKLDIKHFQKKKNAL